MRQESRTPYVVCLLALIQFAVLSCASLAGPRQRSAQIDPTGSIDSGQEVARAGDLELPEVPGPGEGEESVPAGAAEPVGGEEPVGETSDERLSEEWEDLLESMEEAYEDGIEAYRAGRFDEARGHFDRAVDLVLSGPVELSEHPELKAAFDEIVRDIADLDIDLYSREINGRATASPLDSLKDITSFLSPEEAEKERQLIQQVAEQVVYDIPIVLNSKVLGMVELFQTRLRKEFEAGLKRSGAYLPLIKEIFRSKGLPEDLAYMAHQESSFKNTAYSRAKAKGMWQFMSFTGRKYGLRRDIWVDERSDFEKATHAAAAYLTDLYARYGDWYLAMAAYNAGEGKIDRAIRRAGTKDFWKLSKTRYIRRETKNYIPAIIASILIDKSPQDYGFDVELDPVLRWDTVVLDKPTDLQVIADGAGATVKTIRSLNPELRGLVTPPNVDVYTVRVPEGKRQALLAKLETLPDDQRISWARHKVKKGESFSRIARAYRVPLRALLDANPRYARRRRSLPIGVILNVPITGGLPSVRQASAREDRPTYESGERVVHRVHRGDTLHEIAVKYRTTVKNLKRWNNIKGSLIRPGQRLVAYYGLKGDGPPPKAAAKPSYSKGERIVHRVRRGDSLSRIAAKYRTTVSNLRRWNNLNGSLLRPGQRIVAYYGERGYGPKGTGGHPGGVAAATEGRPQYRVKRGDTLTGIARKFGVGLNDLCRWNGLTLKSVLHPRDRLWVGDERPVAQTGRSIKHRVKRGENLYRIARRYNVTIKEVQAWNNLGNRSTIYPGQVLRIAVR